MILPVTLISVTFLFTLIMILIVNITHVKEAQMLYQERVKSKYVAESGIAVMQQQLRLNRENPGFIDDERMIQVEDRHVFIKMVESTPSYIRVQATSWGEQGVVQTAEAFLHPETFSILKWVR